MGMKWMRFILLVSLHLFICLDSASAADGNGTDAGNIGVPVFPPPVDPPPSPYYPPASDSPPTPPYDQSYGGGDNDPGPNAVPVNQPVYPPPYLAPPVFPQAETDYDMTFPVNGTGQERAWCDGNCSKTLTCPVECPYRVPSNSSVQGCFIHCSKCEATCKWRNPNCDNYGPSCYSDVQPPPSSPLGSQSSEPPPALPDAGNGGVPVFPPPVDPPPSPYDPLASDSPPTPPSYDQSYGGGDNDPGPSAVPVNQPVYPPPSLAPPIYPLADTDYYMAIPVNETGQEQAWCFRDCGKTLVQLSALIGCLVTILCKDALLTAANAKPLANVRRNSNCDNYGPLCYGDVQPPPSPPLGSQSSKPPPALPDAGNGGVPVFPPPVDPPPSPYDPLASDSPPMPPSSNYSPTTNSNYYYMVASVERTGQEQAFCYAEGSCNNKILTCPAECPYRKPSNRTMKECNIDCSRKCEATCKWRKPLCDNFGSLCYDPRFVGGDGNMFYFHGFKGGNFAIVTDDHLQINSHFIGHRPKGKKRDLTWVQALSIMFDTHTLILAAKRVSKWDDKDDVLLVKWDNQLINIPTDGQSEWRINSDNRVVVIERTDEFNTIRATVSGLVQVDTRVVPIGEHENKVHNYQIPADDAYAHLETQFKFFKLSDTVEGVLGKTYQPGYESPVKMGDAMPVMGGEDKYLTPSLSSPLCKLSKFKRPSSNSIAMVTEI